MVLRPIHLALFFLNGVPSSRPVVIHGELDLCDIVILNIHQYVHSYSITFTMNRGEGSVESHISHLIF